MGFLLSIPHFAAQAFLKLIYYIVSPVSRHIVLMRTNIINLLNRVPEHDSLTFFVLHRTECKPMHFERERFSDVTLTLTLPLTLNPNPNPNPNPKP